MKTHQFDKYSCWILTPPKGQNSFYTDRPKFNRFGPNRLVHCSPELESPAELHLPIFYMQCFCHRASTGPIWIKYLQMKINDSDVFIKPGLKNWGLKSWMRLPDDCRLYTAPCGIRTKWPPGRRAPLHNGYFVAKILKSCESNLGLTEL